MTFAKYDKMKDSGVSWIGEIPDTWSVNKLKFVCDIKRGKFTHRPRNDPALYGGAYPFIQTGDVENSNKEILDFSQTLNEKGLSVSSLFPSNTIVMTIAATIGSIAITTFPVCFPDSIVGFRSSELKFPFLYYYLKMLKKYLEGIASFTTQKNINYEFLKPLIVPIPVLEEQKEIGIFLNTKMDEIDDEIFKNEKLIKLLKKQKESVINRAVTKGLDDSILMQDSGISWLGKIPKNWIISKLKFESSIRGRVGWKGFKKTDLVDNGALVLGAKHIQESKLFLKEPNYLVWEKYYESPEIMVNQNDILIVQRGSIGKVVLIDQNIGNATINPSLVLLTNIQFLPKYLWYVLQSYFTITQLKHISQTTAVPMISQENIGNLNILSPGSIKTQKQIVDYLDKKVMKIDSLISKVQLQIKNLGEVRESLISSTVTGKICISN